MKNSIPVITANFAPFKIFLKEEKEIPWFATLDQINKNNYDLDRFNEIIGLIDIGISPYSLVISRDGTLHLPRINKYQDLSVALYEFNQFLTCVFLGGENFEFVWSNDIGLGLILENKTSIICSDVEGKAANFHKLAKAGFLSKAEGIKLAYPAYISFENINKSYAIGKTIIRSLDNMSLQPMLYGATFYKNRNYSESLIHFWTITEVLIESFWKNKLVSSFKDQNIGLKINILYENKLIDLDLKKILDAVRKKRNKLAHKGEVPNVEDTKLSITCAFQILSLVITDFEKIDNFDYLIKMLNNTAFVNSPTFDVSQIIEIPEWFEVSEKNNDLRFKSML